MNFQIEIIKDDIFPLQVMKLGSSFIIRVVTVLGGLGPSFFSGRGGYICIEKGCCFFPYQSTK